MPLVRWMTPVDFGPNSPGGCTSIFLICGAQLGHCSMRARWSQALCDGRFTVNSRRINSIILQAPSSIFAAVPARGFDFLLCNWTNVDVRLEPVEDRAPAHMLAHDD